MSKRTIGLIIGLFIVTGVLLYMAVLPNKKNNNKSMPVAISPSPTVSPAETVLSLSPAEQTVTAGVPSSINIDVATGNNSITGAQIELSYDPTALRNVSIVPANFFPPPVVELYKPKIDLKNGRISYALAISPNQTSRSGTGTLATLKFTPVLSGSPSAVPSQTRTTTVKFMPKSLVTARGIGPSVLKSTTDATILISRFAPRKTTTPSPMLKPTNTSASPSGR